MEKEGEPPKNTTVVVSNTPPRSIANVSASSDDGLCPVCIEKPNKQRPFINCPCCDYKSCSRCLRTYLLSIPTPKCMKCGEVWTRPFLFKNFPAVFLREMRIKNIQTKYEREIAMLPLAQAVLDHEKKMKELVCAVEVVQDHIAELAAQMSVAKREKARLVRELYMYENGHKKGHIAYLRPCPNGTCRGFLSTSWKCGTCDKTVCSQCHEIKEETGEHTCNEDSVKTAKMIEADSRPCPKCRAYIFKIDGCNQLWCVNCHTAFNWDTGRIIEDTRYFHNPHYFDWMRSQENFKEHPNDNRCVVREMNSMFIVLFGQKISPLSHLRPSCHERLTFFIREKCRKIVELKSDILPKFRLTVEKENEDLRLAYLKNKISLERLREILARRYTIQESKQEYGQVLSMFINSFTDIAFRLREDVSRFVDNLDTLSPQQLIVQPFTRTRNGQRSANNQQYAPLTEGLVSDLENRIISPLFLEMENLRIYTNECLTEIRRSFGLKREYYIGSERLEWKNKTIFSEMRETYTEALTSQLSGLSEEK